MSKFDLEKALKGEPVVLRNGQKAYVRYQEKTFYGAPALYGYRHLRGKDIRPVFWETAKGGFSTIIIDGGLDIVGMWSEPPVFEHWGLLREDIKYLAKDADGDWYGYSVKPSKGKEFWDAQRYDGYYSVEALKPSLFPDCSWENSLIERPENEKI